MLEYNWYNVYRTWPIKSYILKWKVSKGNRISWNNLTQPLLRSSNAFCFILIYCWDSTCNLAIQIKAKYFPCGPVHCLSSLLLKGFFISILLFTVWELKQMLTIIILVALALSTFYMYSMYVQQLLFNLNTVHAIKPEPAFCRSGNLI